ncbi:hypothetical protein L7F22_016432 [Adiantum nelumboides]|nr:hypothetical protein [Adiantum nelumboides]
MKTLGWPPNFVARCPVRLFEAAGGSNVWAPSGTAGEFHMRPLGNAVLHFQLRDLLDNQILFEHTMRKPDSFIVSARCFFVLRLENGSFRGFGFSEENAASEMKRQVQKAVKPYRIQDYSEESLQNDSAALAPKASIPDGSEGMTGSTSKKETSVMSYESVPRRSTKRPSQRSREQELTSGPSLEIAVFSAAPRSNMFQSKWKIVLKGLSGLSRIKRLGAISQVLGRREREMEIGYPTDVKHVAHIGWDGPSVGGPNWIDELKPAPDFSSGPLKEFGQPRGPDWIHDASSAAKWTPTGVGETSTLPPKPPAEYLDPDTAQVNKKKSKWKVFGSGQKSSNETARIH